MTPETQVSEYEAPDNEFVSSHGRITFEEWCRAETERLRQAGIIAVVRRRKFSIALFRTN